MSWKRMIFGEKTPDKNDPRYKERYQKEVEAGRKTARFLKIDKLSAALQRFATNNPKRFLAIVISLMVFCFCYNIYCVVQVCSRPDHTVTATQIQRQRLEKRKAKEAQLIQDANAQTQHDLIVSGGTSQVESVKASIESNTADNTLSNSQRDAVKEEAEILEVETEAKSQNHGLEPLNETFDYR